MTQAPPQPDPPESNPPETEPPESAAADAPHVTDDIVVKCMSLTKVFKDFWLRDKVRAVDGIDLEIRRGEVFGLLGPNGSGKSTTIKMILGLLHPTTGRIAVFNKVPRDVGTKKRIGYLPEETYLYKFLTPIETLDYYGKLFHQDRATRRKRIDMLLEMVGLDHAARRPVGEFSKGMMRKVGLAQALINDPELLILDEPTSGMDPIATNDVKNVITRLADRGKTVLLCSHLLADVQDVCDRVSMMYGGKVRRSGTMDTLLTDQHKTTITAPALTDISDEQMVAALEALGVTDVSLDHPRRTLEQVFLEMVHEAQSAGIESAGARSGREVAEFLRDGESVAPAQPETREQLIESLVSDEPAAPVQAPAPQPDPAPKPEAKDDLIADLTAAEDAAFPQPKPAPVDKARNSAKPAKESPPPKPPAPDRPKDPDEGDGSVIDDLLNG
ncbi:ABC transporter ATP-binding protein [Phycisphaeraceae bacterium D3-23]